MMEKLSETAVKKRRQNLLITNTLDFAQRLLDRWNAERVWIYAAKERDA